MKPLVENHPEYGRIKDWQPDKPRCCDCYYFRIEEESRDYAMPLFCGIVCTERNLEDDDGSGFPFDPAPEQCLESGMYSLNVENIFWNSSFADLRGDTIEEVEESMKRCNESLIWWLENIGAIGI